MNPSDMVGGGMKLIAFRDIFGGIERKIQK